MSLSNTFTTIFDKAINNGHAHEYNNKWVVEEHGQSATMTHLEVTADGKFLGFDQNLVKGIKDTTSKMSSKLDDKDCDGIAFLNDNSKKEHLVFAELKSGFDVQKNHRCFPSDYNVVYQNACLAITMQGLQLK